MATNTEVNKHTMVICANMLVKRDNKYLVLKRSPRKAIAPNITHTVGGKVDEGEDPYTAAQRELLEEAGIRAEHIRLRGVETGIKSRGMPDWQIFYFMGDYAGGELLDCDEGELLWLTADELKHAELFPSVRRIIDVMLDESVGPFFAHFTYDDNDRLVDGTVNVLEK